MGFFDSIAEWVSDAIPNEFSKLNNTWVGQIPYVGWGIKGLAAADQFSETYANTGNLFDSATWAANGIMGNAVDPYKYSPKNQAGFTDDWALNIGKVTNIAGAFNAGNYGSGAQGIMGLLGGQNGQGLDLSSLNNYQGYNVMNNQGLTPGESSFQSFLPILQQLIGQQQTSAMEPPATPMETPNFYANRTPGISYGGSIDTGTMQRDAYPISANISMGQPGEVPDVSSMGFRGIYG